MSKKAGLLAALPLAISPADIMRDFPATQGYMNEFSNTAEQINPDIYSGIDFERIARELANNPQRQKELQYLIDQMGQ